AGYGIPLDQADVAKIASNHEAFFEGGLDLRFTSRGRPPRPYYPTYRQLMLEKDLDGTRRGFLVEEGDFLYLKDMQARNLLIPVVGNLAGDHALRAIGKDVDARGEQVSTLYASNVEFYLWRDQSFDRFVENLRALPPRPDTVLIRACFGYGRPHPAAQPGHRSVTLLQSLPRFLERHHAGAYNHDWDVCTADSVR
ncbi:MAG TPA: hypothetical protein VFX50_08015, partial [Gemmatimonadales bacterium]|nr:hypothetical protein [Gemmatimonadales bacterium]